MAIRWRAFPLRPNIPPEGKDIKEVLGSDSEEVWAVVKSLKDTASELGLQFGNLRRVSNSRLAQELGAWADEKGRGEAFHYSVFRCYFVDCKNIARVPVLLDLAEAAGLDRKEASQVLRERSFREAVDRDWALSREMGIRVAPTFVFEGRRVEGAKPYSALEALISAHPRIR